MEEKKEDYGMLDLLLRPAFFVKDHFIESVNRAAEALLVLPGTDVRSLLLTGQEEYAAFEGGCLYLKLNLCAQGCGASVSKMEERLLFILDQEADDAQLQVLALAAQEIRRPLSSVLICADRLIPAADPETREQYARLKRSVHQMMRIVNNMSDAGANAAFSQQETRDMGALFGEIFEKAQTLVAHSGVQLTYRGLQEEVLSLADGAALDRAVLNILSNALKFMPKTGSIEASLSRRGQMLRLSILDSGSGIAQDILHNVFRRYLRRPGIEDSRFGLGLGMVLIRSIAASHGGTVLIDQPDGRGTRITMTLAIRRAAGTQLRSPIMRVDYAGERDHGLLELSECLPVSVYETES